MFSIQETSVLCVSWYENLNLRSTYTLCTSLSVSVFICASVGCSNKNSNECVCTILADLDCNVFL